MSKHLDLINCTTKAHYIAKALRDGGGRLSKAVLPAVYTPDLVKGGPFIGPKGGKWADPQHKIPFDDKKHAGKPTPTAKEHDKHGARELELHIDNTEHLNNESKRTKYGDHQTQRGAIHANLAKKIASGKYDHAQAGKLFGHLVESASKHYSSEHGAPSGGGHHFDPATRSHIAREMADQFHEEVKAGDHDHHVASGVHKKRADKGGGLAAMAEKHGAEQGHPETASKTQPVPDLSTQGHLDEHDRHRGQESVHGHKAKQAEARGDKKEAAHHKTMAQHHKHRADVHSMVAEDKRLGGVPLPKDVPDRKLPPIKKSEPETETETETEPVENPMGYSSEVMQWYTA